MAFKSFTGITIGSSHEATGKPCEDSFRVDKTTNGKWTCAVVSDGCGSSENARDGAIFISDFILEGLINFAPLLDKRGPGDWLIDQSVLLLAGVREAMRQKFKSHLTHYSATIIGAMISESGGFILHLGDGVASAFSLDKDVGKQALKLVVQSDPENGEYANQTFYVTESSWIRHVRITSVSDAECLVLCTDGAQDLFYEGKCAHGPALVPLLKGLSTAPDGPNKFLEQKITSPEAVKISSDDKTIVVLAHPAFLAGLPSIKNTNISGIAPKLSPKSSDVPLSRISVSPPSLYQPGSSEKPSNQTNPSDAPFLTVGQARWIGIYASMSFSVLIVIAGVIFLGMWVWEFLGPDEIRRPQLTISKPLDKTDDQIVDAPTSMKPETKPPPSSDSTHQAEEIIKPKKDPEELDESSSHPLKLSTEPDGTDF